MAPNIKDIMKDEPEFYIWEHQQVIIFSADSLSYWGLYYLIYINTENIKVTH